MLINDWTGRCKWWWARLHLEVSVDDGCLALVQAGHSLARVTEDMEDLGLAEAHVQPLVHLLHHLTCCSGERWRSASGFYTSHWGTSMNQHGCFHLPGDSDPTVKVIVHILRAAIVWILARLYLYSTPWGSGPPRRCPTPRWLWNPDSSRCFYDPTALSASWDGKKRKAQEDQEQKEYTTFKQTYK